MRVNFDNLRRNLAQAYNDLVPTITTKRQAEACTRMGDALATLIALYDDSIEDDLNSLADEITMRDPWLLDEP
jgi:hypothetical protein